VVGVNLKGGRIVLLGRWLCGRVARESHSCGWSCLPRSCHYCIAPRVWLPNNPSRSDVYRSFALAMSTPAISRRWTASTPRRSMVMSSWSGCVAVVVRGMYAWWDSVQASVARLGRGEDGKRTGGWSAGWSPRREL